MTRTDTEPKPKDEDLGWPVVVHAHGHTVRFRTEFPTDDNTIALAEKMSGMDAEHALRDAVKLLPDMTESWDYEGDPHDPEAWKKLPFFSETLKYANALGDYLNVLTGEAQTSPAK